MTPARFETTRPHDYLLRLAASDRGREYKALAVSELGICRGDTVLDLGCGPGADLPALAKAAGAGGRVIGVDNDPRSVRAAIGRAAGFPQVKVVQADIHALGIPDGTVHRAHADRVLQHVADPPAVLREVRRVLRPRGCAVLAEPDWDTLIIDYPDLSVARAYTRFVSDRLVRNACIGRQLTVLATRAGLQITKVMPITTVFRDAQEADQVLGLRRVTERAVTAGYLTAESARHWLSYLADQPFFASATLCIVAAAATDMRGLR
jgi:ubiquinone/menaquinone biosynthesis C-methylase UbiE